MAELTVFPLIVIIKLVLYKLFANVQSLKNKVRSEETKQALSKQDFVNSFKQIPQ